MTTEMIQSTDLAEKTLEKALKHCQEAQAQTTQSEQFEVNFESQHISLIRTTYDITTGVSVYDHGKKGSASFNGTEDRLIEESVNNATTAMKASIADPAAGISNAFSVEPVSLGSPVADREKMVSSVQQFIKTIKEKWPSLLTESSFYKFVKSTTSFINSNGTKQQETRSGYVLTLMFTAKKGIDATSISFTSLGSFTPFDDFLAEESIIRLINDSLNSFNAKPVPKKFTGTLIFTPESLGDLVGSVTGALGGMALMSKTTPYIDKLGESIASPLMTLRNSPRHVEFPLGSHFDNFGIETNDLTVIENGILRDYMIDFYSSKKLDMNQNCGATNLIVEPGKTPLDEIIKNTKQGIVMSRFSGGQPNANLDFSGIAKNAFYIEDGEIKFPLVETMISGNFQEVLKNISAISSETVNDGRSIYPWVATEGVTISPA